MEVRGMMIRSIMFVCLFLVVGCCNYGQIICSHEKLMTEEDFELFVDIASKAVNDRREVVDKRLNGLDAEVLNSFELQAVDMNWLAEEIKRVEHSLRYGK